MKFNLKSTLHSNTKDNNTANFNTSSAAKNTSSVSPTKKGVDSSRTGFFDKNQIGHNRVKRERMDKVFETKFATGSLQLEKQQASQVTKGGVVAASLGLKAGSGKADKN